MDRSMIDATSGGALVNKTPAAAKQLITSMAENSQQFDSRGESGPKRINEVSTSTIEDRLTDLTNLVRQMAVNQGQNARVCGICSMIGHTTDKCPTLQENDDQQANAIGGYQNQPQRRYDPYSNHYNPGWRDHPNFSYGNQGAQQRYHPPVQNRPPPQQGLQQYPSLGISLDDIVKVLATNTQ